MGFMNLAYPLTIETLEAILQDEIPDEILLQIIWHCLGYQFNCAENRWTCDEVPPPWHENYPEPPDFINNRAAIVQLNRSIAAEHKQLLKQELGFKGYKISQLNPRLTRRATIANWLLSYLRLNAS